MFSSVEAEVVGLAVYFHIYVYMLLFTWLIETVVHALSCIKTSKNIVQMVNSRCASQRKLRTMFDLFVTFVYRVRHPP